MIICGFAGVGKSTVARRCTGWVDLESTPFNRDWERYVKVIKHMDENGYNVMVSCHKELREELIKNKIKFTVDIPSHDDKENY